MQAGEKHPAASPARRAAWEILLELRRNPRSHSDQLLRSPAVNRLSPTDRNLTTALVMGVLRWGIELDRQIADAAGQRTEPLDDEVEVAVELGALQLWFFDRIPAHAAIFESVELVKGSKSARAAGLANAVLRKLQRLPPPDPERSRPNSAADIARAWAHPKWLVERWVDAYGAVAAARICRYNQFPPPVSIRLPAGASKNLVFEVGVESEPGAIISRAGRILRGDPLSATGAGLWVQDEGSQLIGELAAGCAAHSSAVLDCCAAPGGKLGILAERLPEARFVALDIHAGRLASAKRLLAGRNPGAQIEFHCADAAIYDPGRKFDLVLLDAPCSGTGTLARNPEIRYRLSLDDFQRQQQRQARLLNAALDVLGERGRLVYSTCSLEAEENEQVIEQALRKRSGFRLIPARGQVADLEEKGILRAGSTSLLFPEGAPAEFLRTIPGIHPCDGFFAAILARES